MYPEQSAESLTAFRAAEKRYQLHFDHTNRSRRGRRRNGSLKERSTDFSDVIDFLDQSTWPCSGVQSCITACGLPAYTLQRQEGFCFFPGALPPEDQQRLVRDALGVFPTAPGRTNHYATLGVLPEGFWEAATQGLHLYAPDQAQPDPLARCLDPPTPLPPRRTGPDQAIQDSAQPCSPVPDQAKKDSLLPCLQVPNQAKDSCQLCSPVPDETTQGSFPSDRQQALPFRGPPDEEISKPSTSPRPSAASCVPHLHAPDQAKPNPMAALQNQAGFSGACSSALDQAMLEDPLDRLPCPPRLPKRCLRLPVEARPDLCTAPAPASHSGTPTEEAFARPHQAKSEVNRDPLVCADACSAPSMELAESGSPACSTAGGPVTWVRASCGTAGGPAASGSCGGGEGPAVAGGGSGLAGDPGPCGSPGGGTACGPVTCGRVSCGTDRGGEARSLGCCSKETSDVGVGSGEWGSGPVLNGRKQSPEGVQTDHVCWSHGCHGPPATDLLRRLRWATLGPPFNWTTRVYERDAPMRHLPPYLRDVAVRLAAAAGDFCSQASCAPPDEGNTSGETPGVNRGTLGTEQEGSLCHEGTASPGDGACADRERALEEKVPAKCVISASEATLGNEKRDAGRGASRGGFDPDAALVNYYRQGETLGGHRDDAEEDLSQPIVTFSIGCDAIFLLGGETKDEAPTAMLVRSGDAVVLGGRARRCYHGLPRILRPAVPPPALDPDTVPSDLRPMAEFMQGLRVNVSVRAVG
eukprot:jgi/Botrbrau1/20056/Bobra.200_1s0061.1